MSAAELRGTLTQVLYSVADNFVGGVVPAIKRVKREAKTRNERDFLDFIVTCVGAAHKRQEVRLIIERLIIYAY